MTFTKNRKSPAALALALALTASLSVSAFASETPLVKSTPNAAALVTASSQAEKGNAVLLNKTPSKVAALELRPHDSTSTVALELRPHDSTSTVAFQLRTNEKTGEDEISEDGGKTWKEYDGKAFAILAPMVEAQPSK